MPNMGGNSDRTGSFGVKLIEKSAAFVLSCVIVFLLVEGLCSSLVVMHGLKADLSTWWTLKPCTQYDPHLGWVNIPNFHEKASANPGEYITTNSKGFRDHQEFDVRIPDHRVRVICSGDSFTFGMGVGDDHTWCEQLASLDPRLQTINMGVPGYGVDQAYLWYMREGARLDHDVQVLAVIADDFQRMLVTNFVGYEKPLLQAQGDQLLVSNVPVPKISRLRRWTFTVSRLLLQLRTLQVLRWALHAFRPTPSPSQAPPSEAQRQEVARIIETLKVVNQRKNSLLVLVYLPWPAEYPDAAHLAVDSQEGWWRDLVRDEAAKRGIPFIDFLDDTQRLTISEVQRLFIPPSLPFSLHLSEYGNEYVARKLYRFLTDNPQASAKLSGIQRTPTPRSGTEMRSVGPDFGSGSSNRHGTDLFENRGH